MKRKAQMSIPFNWIYILIAGAIILLFFIGIVVRQKSVAQSELSIIVSQKLDSIFTSAALSDQTTVLIDVPEFDFYFTCDEGGVSEYRVGDDGSPNLVPLQPVFAPSHMKASQIVTWALEFNMPYKVINFLLVGSPTITTYVVYDDGNSQSVRLKNKIVGNDVPEQFKFNAVTRSAFENDQLPAPFESVRVIFLTNRIDPPASLRRLDDEDVTAVRITPDETATFYKKNGVEFVPVGGVNIIPLPGGSGLGDDEKNPAFYAALFSEDGVSYSCNINKAFRRLQILADIYEDRTEQIKNIYTQKGDQICEFQADPQLFKLLKSNILLCDTLDGVCLAAVSAQADIIRQRNIIMQDRCAVLY